jgi:hypothetical protein
VSGAGTSVGLGRRCRQSVVGGPQNDVGVMRVGITVA